MIQHRDTATPRHRDTATPRHRLIAMLLMLALACPLFTYSQMEDWDEDDDYSFYEDQYSYVSLENACRTLSTITALHVVNFESASKLFMRIDQPGHMLWQNSLIVQKGQQQELLYIGLTFNESSGYFVGTLEPDETYHILALNTCNEFVAISKVSTTPLPPNAMIEVSEKMWKAMARWSAGTGEDLFAFLDNQSEITRVEKTAFLQNFVLDGTRLPDLHLNSLNGIDNTMMTIRDSKNEDREDCFCRVLRITLSSDISPTGNDSQGNPNIESLIMPETTPINTSSLITSYSGELKGPAKAKSIMGNVHVNKCANTTMGSSWGDSPNTAGLTPAEAVVISNLSTTVGYALVRIKQVCHTPISQQGNCYCPQLVSYAYSYDSFVTTSARTKAGVCFNPPGKTAQAKAEDFGAFMAIRTKPSPNEEHEFVEEFVHSDFAVTRVATTCEKVLNTEVVLDLLKFSLAMVGYVKGLPIKWDKLGGFSGTTAAEIIEQITNVAYNQYNTSSASSALAGIITAPWIIGNEDGECKTATGGIFLRGKKYAVLHDNETLNFIIVSADYLEVNGRTRWRADAAIRSGYSLSLALHEQERDEDDCCTRPAGIYSFATFHPTMQPIAYKQWIGSHFSEPLGPYFPTTSTDYQVIINHDRGILIAPLEVNNELDCPNTKINGRSLEAEAPTARHIDTSSPEIVLIGNELHLRHAKPNVSYQIQLYAMDGKLVENQGGIMGDGAISSYRLNQLPAGIYAVRLLGNDQFTSTTKILLP
jgi:hypothetical protein